MAQTLKFGNGTWATKKGSTLAYNDENDRFKPLPFTTTRASGATRVNKEGLIEVVEGDRPRIDYTDSADGVLLLEPSRTNLFTYSEDFSNVYWNKTSVTVTSNEAISPDGTLNASKLIEGTSNSRQEVWKNIVTSSSTNVISCFIKKGTRRFASITTSDTTNWNTMVVVDLELGIVTKTYNLSGFSSVNKIENYGNGWYRLTSSITGVVIGDVLYARINIQNSGTPSNPPSNSYTGDGTSYIYIYGAQIEEGSYPTSYIPTNGAAVTRAAETATGSGDASTFNDSEGVLMAEISALADDLTNRTIGVLGDSNNFIELAYRNTSNQVRCLIKSSGVVEVNIQHILSDITLNNKLAVKYKSNNTSLYVNGFEVATGLSANMPSGLNKLNFNRFDGAEDFYGNTKELAYYNTALTDLELETLTSYRSLNELVTELNLKAL